MKKIIKRTLILLLLLIILLLGAFGYLLFNIDKNVEDKVFSNRDVINILIVGKESSLTLENIDENSPVHTDTIMILKVDNKSRRAKIISIPRDTYFEYLPGSKKRHQKINAAYFLGGIENTKEVIEDFLDIKIDNYVEVDYKFVADVINALGGMEINWEYDDYYYEDNWTSPPLVIDLHRGINQLSGEEAVNYLRARNAYADADLGRIKAQQEFVVSLFKKIKEPANLLIVPKLVSLFNKEAESDIEFEDCIYLGYYAFKYLNSEKISLVTLQGEDLRIDGIEYYKINKTDAREIYLEN
ncbi:LCP family protein [Anaerosphaera multitolerans]|uniref:LytR family transcriptional regulator n=1 Tax=Anaerosphaera multitolerans TaxID=2487351 RepID=A0A437S6B5_9FIRM|nr:LCP family protein [Anaerosphaera multitolerans]RVU54547.1 LytR family transcriptional regulator [Anaerosphaera multitolerans]